MSILFVIGSTRPVRNGGPIGEATLPVVQSATDREVSVVDLRDLALPFVDEPLQAASGVYQQPHTQAWAARPPLPRPRASSG